MIVQPKQQNQPYRECLYAWYPEVIDGTTNTTSTNPRDIYLNNGINKDLLEQKSSTNGCKQKKKKNFIFVFFDFIHLIVVVTNAYNNNNTSTELLQRYKQSIAPSDRAYHSVETLDEALTPPWALHYELKRRPATPNPPSNPTDSMSN
jgi:hypothetical protein